MLDLAVKGAMASKFRNTGQTCVCTNRLYVQDGVYDAFAAKLVEAVAQLKGTHPQEQQKTPPKLTGLLVGSPLDKTVTQGPLVNQAAATKVNEHVQEALSKGAQVLCGGQPHTHGPLYFQPTVLANVTSHMLVCSRETFGPVAPLLRFTTVEEGIKVLSCVTIFSKFLY